LKIPKSKIILKLKGVYWFDSTKSLLTLTGGSLLYVPNRQYEICVATIYMDIKYYQKVIINIDKPPQIPISIIQ
jgi:hypothetical protein